MYRFIESNFGVTSVNPLNKVYCDFGTACDVNTGGKNSWKKSRDSKLEQDKALQIPDFFFFSFFRIHL